MWDVGLCWTPRPPHLLPDTTQSPMAVGSRILLLPVHALHLRPASTKYIHSSSRSDTTQSPIAVGSWILLLPVHAYHLRPASTKYIHSSSRSGSSNKSSIIITLKRSGGGSTTAARHGKREGGWARGRLGVCIYVSQGCRTLKYIC